MSPGLSYMTPAPIGTDYSLWEKFAKKANILSSIMIFIIVGAIGKV